MKVNFNLADSPQLFHKSATRAMTKKSNNQRHIKGILFKKFMNNNNLHITVTTSTQ